MVLFKDLNKEATDLLKKDFPLEKAWEVEHRYKGANPQITCNASVSPSKELDKSATLKYSLDKYFWELKLNTTTPSSCEVKYSLPQVKGLTLSSRYEFAGKALKESLELGSEFSMERLHGKFQINPMTGLYNLSCVTSACPGSYFVGGEAKGNVDLSTFNCSFGASYFNKTPRAEWAASIVTAPQGKTNFAVVKCHLRGKTVAFKQPTHLFAEIQRNIIEGKSSLTFGGLWYLNDASDTFIKAKVSHEAKVAVALSHKFSESLSATVGTEVDTTKTGSDSIKYGIRLSTSA
ncbi:eukaryotic porin protein [Cardiosporidium cionae]|uniref:Eukaryotic porin protein n=1 Tax=Cardiosporidium cionae TaxID=476202 RepID=A0ABQ7J7B6_9APIC|nr:eukaryotic porin protein [Cardiosporidium cionae]|eukprot:KAF8819874.1 eukaryotic porin protein [Cardiosporidium cionae]